MKTKEKVEHGKGTADHLMPLGYLLKLLIVVMGQWSQMVPHRGDLSLSGQPEGLRGLPKSLSVWEARQMVKRAVKGSQRPIGESRGQLEGLRGQINGQEGSQRVREANRRVKRPTRGSRGQPGGLEAQAGGDGKT